MHTKCKRCGTPHLVAVENVQKVYPSFPGNERMARKLETAKASAKTTVICASCGELYRDGEWR